MLSIDLLKMSCERNRVNKQHYLTGVRSIQGTFRDNCDILNPVIMIQTPYENEMELPTNFNYAYISELGRYYFIENIEIVTSTLYVLYLKVDVLYSYVGEIRQQVALIERNENQYDRELKDEREILYPNFNTEVIEYTNTFFFDPSAIPSDGVEDIHCYITTIVGAKNVSET